VGPLWGHCNVKLTNPKGHFIKAQLLLLQFLKSLHITLNLTSFLRQRQLVPMVLLTELKKLFYLSVEVTPFFDQFTNLDLKSTKSLMQKKNKKPKGYHIIKYIMALQ
jgi:hypothetical protein